MIELRLVPSFAGLCFEVTHYLLGPNLYNSQKGLISQIIVNRYSRIMIEQITT